MYKNILKILFLSTLVSSCSSNSYQPPYSSVAPEKIVQWKALLKDENFLKEKEIYESRIGGLTFCMGTGLDIFLSNEMEKPNEKCVYPSSRLSISHFGQKSESSKLIKQLKVFQVMENGFIVTSPNPENKQLIFVQKSDEKNVVDNSYLDDTKSGGLYQYMGTYTYSTFIGSKTIHAFARISKETLDKAVKGLKSYEPNKEFLIDNQLWEYLDEYEKKLSLK